MTKKYPLVSVIVPAYNHERYIERCILSVVEQSYPNVELTVIDDESSDNTYEIAMNLQKEYDFRLIRQKNRGCATTLNRGISEFSTGKYISTCSSDDYFLKDKIKKHVEYMEANPLVMMSFSKSYYVDENEVILDRVTRSASKGLKGGRIFTEILLQEFHLPVGQMYRRQVFNTVGLFKEGIWTEDFYMNLKITEQFEVGFLDEFLYCYRFPCDFHKKLSSLKVAESHLACINEYRNSPLYMEAIKKWNYRNFLWYCESRKNKLFAIKGMLNSATYVYKYGFIKSIFRLIFVWR